MFSLVGLVFSVAGRDAAESCASKSNLSLLPEPGLHVGRWRRSLSPLPAILLVGTEDDGFCRVQLLFTGLGFSQIVADVWNSLLWISVGGKGLCSVCLKSESQLFPLH